MLLKKRTTRPKSTDLIFTFIHLERRSPQISLTPPTHPTPSIPRHSQANCEIQSLQWFLRFPRALHTLRHVLPLANRQVSLRGAQITSVRPISIQRCSSCTPRRSRFCQAPHPITESKPSNSAEEPRFRRLYVRPYAFGHYAQLVTRDDDRDVDQ